MHGCMADVHHVAQRGTWIAVAGGASGYLLDNQGAKTRLIELLAGDWMLVSPLLKLFVRPVNLPCAICCTCGCCPCGEMYMSECGFDFVVSLRLQRYFHRTVSYVQELPALSFVECVSGVQSHVWTYLNFYLHWLGDCAQRSRKVYCRRPDEPKNSRSL